MSRRVTVILPGRILYLCDDADTLRAQLNGRDLDTVPSELRDNISTDEITPNWVCYWYDETLGRYVLIGLKDGAVERDSLKKGGFGTVVAGKSMGCGSSRETAPYAFKAAGVKILIARSFEKIFRQNCQNIGLYTSTDFGLINRIKRGVAIPANELTAGLDPIATEIVSSGGLFAYNKARLAGRTAPAVPLTPPRPMTAVEKIIAAHAIQDAHTGSMGLPAVAPEDSVFCRTDVRFSHEYVTPMAAALFREGFGPKTRVADPTTCFAFRDHLTFLSQVMTAERKQQGLLKLADDLAVTQARFCKDQGIDLFGEDSAGGSRAICHCGVLEEIALPGQLLLGTDSHTCTAGAVGCLAFGVGATDMANAWLTRDVWLSVPKTVLVELSGSLGPGLSAKDAMLALLAQPYIKEGHAIGQVLEFTGPGLAALSLDERATLTNMAIEAGAFSGFIAADALTIRVLAELRRISPKELERRSVRSDTDATFAHRLSLNLSEVEAMVALPGDPRNGLPVRCLGPEVKIDIAYGGSCTGGKCADMDAYATVLTKAVAKGARVKGGVQLYIQFGSQKVKAYAKAKGYVTIFEKAGAELLDPSCGACINAGPGVSERPDQVTVSAINRNFPGRSGPGQVYLASPAVVAASAIAGYITTP